MKVNHKQLNGCGFQSNFYARLGFAQLSLLPLSINPAYAPATVLILSYNLMIATEGQKL